MNPQTNGHEGLPRGASRCLRTGQTHISPRDDKRDAGPVSRAPVATEALRFLSACNDLLAPSLSIPLNLPAVQFSLRQGCTGLHRVAWSCTGLHGVARGCTGLHGVARGCTGLHWVARSCTRLHGVARGCTELPLGPEAYLTSAVDFHFSGLVSRLRCGWLVGAGATPFWPFAVALDICAHTHTRKHLHRHVHAVLGAQLLLGTL